MARFSGNRLRTEANYFDIIVENLLDHPLNKDRYNRRQLKRMDPHARLHLLDEWNALQEKYGSDQPQEQLALR